MAGPLLEAIERDQRCVLLIDEIDKVDYAFEAQAFKRACSCFGLGRYFYRFAEMWVDLNENKQPKTFRAYQLGRFRRGKRRSRMQPGRRTSGQDPPRLLQRVLLMPASPQRSSGIVRNLARLSIRAF
jgi:hypothetical protein